MDAELADGKSADKSKKSDILDKRESTQVKAGLTRLQRVLREGNMQATSAFDALQEHAGAATLNELSGLANAMKRLDFSTALQHCTDIRQNITENEYKTHIDRNSSP